MRKYPSKWHCYPIYYVVVQPIQFRDFSFNVTIWCPTLSHLYRNSWCKLPTSRYQQHKVDPPSDWLTLLFSFHYCFLKLFDLTKVIECCLLWLYCPRLASVAPSRSKVLAIDFPNKGLDKMWINILRTGLLWRQIRFSVWKLANAGKTTNITKLFMQNTFKVFYRQMGFML